MEAANAGAHEVNQDGKIHSHGVCIGNINRPETPNAFLSRQYMHGNFFTRLHQFARLSSAFVVMKGGVGTMLELFTMWQLLQVGHLRDTPVILVGAKWPGLLDWMRDAMIPDGCLDLREFNHVFLVSSVDDAIPIIMEAFGRFKLKNAAG